MKHITSISVQDIEGADHELSEEENKFNVPEYGSFPSSAVLLFRRYFLDIRHENHYIRWLYSEDLWQSVDNDDLYKKYIFMYRYIVAHYDTEDFNTSMGYLCYAINKPVLNVEDRLMNYYAVQKALDVIEKYDNPPDEDKFSSFLNYVQNNENLRGFQSTIIPKLRDLYDMSNRNLIEELYRELSTNNELINEDVLHLIVTSVFDMDTESEKYKANIQNIKIAIKLLNVFVKFHKKINANTTRDYDYNEVEDEQETYGSTIIFYAKIAKTEYSTKEFQIKNCFIAYKWLMELHGIVSHNDINTFKDINNNITELMKYEKNIIKTENFKEDQHYMFLQVKEKSNKLLKLDDWENSNRPADWSLDESTYKCLSILNPNVILSLIKKLNAYLTCRYVNKIEFYIIAYRFHRRFTKNYVEKYGSLKDALSEPVITPEDRLRNLEAHELFSMFLMERNKIAITKAKEIGASKAYNTFLRDPRPSTKL